MRILRKIIKSIGLTILVLIIGLGIYIALNSGDIPPPDVSDLEVPYPDVPDEENTFIVYQKIAPLLEMENGVRQILQVPLGEKFQDPKAVLNTLNRFKQPLDEMAEAALRERCVFPRPTSIDFLIPEVTGILHAGTLWSAEVRVGLQEGNLERASSAATHLLLVGQSVISEPESLIQYLVGSALLTQGVHAIEQLLENPNIEIQILKEFQEQLRMRSTLDRALALAMKSEYRFEAIALKTVQESSGQDDFGGENITEKIHAIFPNFMLKPNTTLKVFADFHRKGIENIGKPLSEMKLVMEDDVLQMIESRKLFPPSPNLLGMHLVGMMLPAVDRVFVTNIRLQGEMRVLRCLISLRRYQMEHDEWPRKLAELVPEFIEEVPVDPFDGKPLRYDPERRIIWSVGEDLIDQNGSTLQREGTRSDERKNQEDMVWEMAW